jgi:chemotaxis protein histidine kinase CheA
LAHANGTVAPGLPANSLPDLFRSYVALLIASLIAANVLQNPIAHFTFLDQLTEEAVLLNEVIATERIMYFEQTSDELIDLQVNDVTFDEEVMRSMSKVVAANNMKAAAENEGQALLITKTKAAEAEEAERRKEEAIEAEKALAVEAEKKRQEAEQAADAAEKTRLEQEAMAAEQASEMKRQEAVKAEAAQVKAEAEALRIKQEQDAILAEQQEATQRLVSNVIDVLKQLIVIPSVQPVPVTYSPIENAGEILTRSLFTLDNPTIDNNNMMILYLEKCDGKIKLRRTSNVIKNKDKPAGFNELKPGDLVTLFDSFQQNKNVNSMRIGILFSDEKLYINNDIREFASANICEDGIDFDEGVIH